MKAKARALCALRIVGGFREKNGAGSLRGHCLSSAKQAKDRVHKAQKRSRAQKQKRQTVALNASNVVETQVLLELNESKPLNRKSVAKKCKASTGNVQYAK